MVCRVDAANREYKNSVFLLLFGRDPALIRELYGALEGVELPPDTPVVINTLEGVLYMAMLNDLSFILADRLVVLIEHQSTINPNMAVRLLLYVSRLYEKYASEKKLNLSGMALLTVPRPEFIVLYNGAAPYPDTAILKLSDSFADAAGLGIPADAPPALELAVKVYNINGGRNEGLVSRCRTLKEYGVFIAKAREYGAERAPRPEGRASERGEAIKRAIRWCIAHDVLKEFLTLHGSEVLNMLLEEWSIEDIAADNARYMREQGIELGLAQGRMEGRMEGREEGREEKREEIARNALAEGFPLEAIRKITGLDLETLQSLAAEA